jgi:hypothetical protein
MIREFNTETGEALSSQPSRFDSPPPRVEVVPPPLPLFASSANPHQMAARGFAQMFGLHPIPAITTLTVNAMLFGGMIITMGALIPLALAVAGVLGFITYKSQMRFYADDHDAALVKALAVALITAIPVGLPAFLTVPSGVVGLVHTLRRKQ